MKDLTRTQIRNRIKKACPNFNADRMQINNGDSYSVKITILDRNKLTTMEMYKTDYSLDLWMNHFIAFFNTGKFDRKAYWMPYTSRGKNFTHTSLEDSPTAMPLCSSFGNDYEPHSPKFSVWMDKYRKTNKDCGFEQVPKPINA